jgi:hypothetical protein
MPRGKRGPRPAETEPVQETEVGDDLERAQVREAADEAVTTGDNSALAAAPTGCEGCAKLTPQDELGPCEWDDCGKKLCAACLREHELAAAVEFDDVDEDDDGEDDEDEESDDEQLPRVAGEKGRTADGERIFAVRASVELPEHERVRKGLELVDAMDRLEEMEGEKAKCLSDFNANLKAQRKTVGSLKKAVKESREVRPVDCREVLDFERAVVRMMAIEDGRELHVRNMTDAERQRPLPLSHDLPDEQPVQQPEEQPAHA